MKTNSCQSLYSVDPVHAVVRGMGREEACELLLNEKPISLAEFIAGVRQASMEWTLLRAPLDLPDGEYTVTAADGQQFRATRSNGFWIHQDLSEPLLKASDVDMAGPEFLRKARHLAAAILQFDQRYGISVLALAVLITYGLPTLVELMAAHDLHISIGIVLFGDVIGCACLVSVLEMPVFGVALYILLTLCEGWLYFTHVISAGQLAWFTDLVPMAIVALRIARMRAIAHPSSRERLS